MNMNLISSNWIRTNKRFAERVMKREEEEEQEEESATHWEKMMKWTQYASLLFVTRCKAHFISSMMKERERGNKHFLVCRCFIRAVVECLVSCRNIGSSKKKNTFQTKLGKLDCHTLLLTHTHKIQINKQTHAPFVYLYVFHFSLTIYIETEWKRRGKQIII